MSSATRAMMEDVQRRHSHLLRPSTFAGGQEGGCEKEQRGKIREHPRWRDLIERSDEEQSGARGQEDKGQAALECSTSFSSFGPAYIPAESTVRNDYSQHFVDTGRLPGNAVGNPDKNRRFEEYPKLKRLTEVKASIAAAISHPPTYLQTDLLRAVPSVSQPSLPASPSFHLSTLLPIKYDVVIIDPPLESYEWESIPGGGVQSGQAWSWDQVAALPIPQIMAKESFIFLWVGSGASDGLERGREVLMRWGYRRCEDIVWVQTNPQDGNKSGGTFVQAASSSCFAKSAQHCLMAIRGTVRRSTDTRFVHCNIDTDVILWPGERDRNASHAIDTRSKPPEMMDLIENFCLGTRRLELFGRNRNLRRGWLTVGIDVGPQGQGWDQAQRGENACAVDAVDMNPVSYEKSRYDSYFGVDRVGCALSERINLVPFNEEVEMLRPRSPSSGQDRRALSSAAATSSRSSLQPPHSLSRPLPDQGFSAVHGGLTPHHHAGGAGISGLGAGGPLVVSVPSGSEMLSGAQASVLQGQAAAGASPPHRSHAPSTSNRPRRSPHAD